MLMLNLLVNPLDHLFPRNYLMNASSKEERDRWIEAIQKATPTSPHMPRKDVTPKSEEKPKPSESRGSEKKEELPPPPSYTARQDTAVDAALAVASCTDTKEEQQAVDDVRTGESTFKGCG